MAVSDPTPASAARIANGASDADHWNFIWCTFSKTKGAVALSILDQQPRE
jgi:hypothetical protein